MATLDDILTTQKNAVQVLTKIAQAVSTSYPFNAYNGGDGVTMTATTASSSVALVGASTSAPFAFVCNQGTGWIFIKFGDSTVTASTASMAVPPGACSLVTITIVGSNAFPTHMAAVTATGSANVQVTMGYGGT